MDTGVPETQLSGISPDFPVENAFRHDVLVIIDVEGVPQISNSLLRLE